MVKHVSVCGGGGGGGGGGLHVNYISILESSGTKLRFIVTAVGCIHISVCM